MGANEWLLYKLNELYLSTQQQMLETSDKQSLKILKKQLASIKANLNEEKKEMIQLSVNHIVFEQGILLDTIPKLGDKSLKTSLNDFLYNVNEKITERKKYISSFISKSDLIMFLGEFYKSLDPDFFELFLKLYKNINTNHHFFVSSNCDDVPCMYPILGSNIVLTCSTYDNNFDDFFNLIHEFAHGIEFLFNPSFFITRGNALFSEVVPIFMELISLDLMDKYDETNSQLVHENMACDYYEIGMNAYMSMLVSKIGMNLANKSEDVILQQCARNLHLSSTRIKEIINITMDGTLKYIISYMVALELYIIYKKDKDKALDIVRKYCFLRDKNPERINNFFVKEGCIAGESVDNYFKQLKRVRKS